MDQEVRRFDVHLYPVVHLKTPRVEAYNQMVAIKGALEGFARARVFDGPDNTFVGEAGHYLVDEFDDHDNLVQSIVVTEDDLKKWEAR